MTQSKIREMSVNDLKELAKKKRKGRYLQIAIWAQEELKHRKNFLSLDQEEQYYSMEFQREYGEEYYHM